MITKSALLGRTLTADYRPSVMGISASWRDHRGAFSFWDIEVMRRDPRIRLGLRVIKSPIAVVKWKVVSENQAVAEWVDKQLKHLWRAELGRLLLMVDYGRAGGEVVWRLDEDTDLVHVRELKHVYSTDMQPLELHGEFWGLRINGAGEDAPIGKCFYLVNDPELNPYYGRSRLLGAWEPWSEKSNRHGAKDIRRLWYAKNAFRGGMMRHPPGSVSLDGGDTKSNQDYAREIAEKIETGGILVLPGAKDAESGEFLWTYEEPKINGDLGGVREYVKDLDGEIFEGLEIPIEIIEAQQSGSWAGRTVPFLVFLTGEDLLADNIITSLDRHILRPGAEANFGRGVKYEIQIESLVPKDEQQPGGAGPAGGDPNDALAALLGGGGGGADGGKQPYQGPRGGQGFKDPATGKISYGEQLSVERLAVGDADPWEAYVGKRGKRKGQQGWRNRITHRIAWGAKPRRWHAPAQRPALEGMQARAGQMLKGGPLHPDHVRDFVEEMLHMSARDMRALASHLGSGTGHAKADLAQRIKDIVEGRKQGKSKEERDKKVAHLRKPASEGQPWTGKGEPDLGKVYNAPTGDLQIDPSRFQFKLNVDSESGVTQELKSVKTWNPDFAGVVSVWKDPADGKTYVVNGHHRRELAGRLGVENLAVRYIKAGSAQEARAIGALINIAEGRGTAVDAAKFMRDTGQGPEALERHGVSLKGKVAADAATLTRLNDKLFDRVARGVLDEGRALAVAKHLPNHDLQDSLFRLLDKREEEGKDLSPKVIEEMAREMAATPTHTKSEASLFGDIESEESLFVERNELKSFVRGELAKDVNDFLAVASKKRAEKIGKAGNIVDPEENRRIADEAARVKATFDTLVNSKGEISDALNKAAADYAKAKGKKERDAIKQRATEAVKQAVFKEAGVGEGPAAGGADAGAVGSSVGGGEAAPGGEPQEPAAATGNSGRSEAEPAGLTGEQGGQAEAKPVSEAAGSQATSTPGAAAAYKKLLTMPERGLRNLLHADDDLLSSLARDLHREMAREPGVPSFDEVKAAMRRYQTEEREKAGIAHLTTKESLWLERAGEQSDDIEGYVKDRVERGIDVPDGVLKMFPGVVKDRDERRSNLHSSLAAIGDGDMGRVGGVNVRRTGKDAYRIEVPTGASVPAGLQTEDERRAGVIRGDAAKVARYLEHVEQHDRMFGRGRTDALTRAESFEEPSFMDAAGLEAARKGFEALPEGAAVVSLEPHSHGRVGRIVVDEDGRKRVKLEGEDGWASSYVEPLDVRHSWRVDRSSEPEAPKQASMFDATVASSGQPEISRDAPQSPPTGMGGRGLTGQGDGGQISPDSRASSGGSGMGEKAQSGSISEQPFESKTASGVPVSVQPLISERGGAQVRLIFKHPQHGEVVVETDTFGPVPGGHGAFGYASIGGKRQKIAITIPKADFDRGIAAAWTMKSSRDASEMEAIKSGSKRIKPRYQQGDPLSGHAVSGHEAALLRSLGLAHDIRGWGTIIDADVVKDLGDEFTYQQAKEYSDTRSAPQKEKAAQKDAAMTAKRKSAFEKARATGKPVEIERGGYLVDDSDNENSYNIVVKWAMPDGTEKTEHVPTH